MAFAAPALKVLGTVVSIATSFMGGNAGADAAEYQAAVARQNAEIAKQNAERIRAQGQQEQESLSLENRGFLGEQLAAQSASGLLVSSRSAVRTRAASRALARLDEVTLRNNAELRAYNSELDATNFEAESNLHQLRAKNERRAGRIRAVGSLISGAQSLRKSSLFSGLLA